MPDLSWPEGKVGKSKRMASERQINKFPAPLAVIITWEQISFTKQIAQQSSTSTSGGSDELKPNTADLREDHHLWGDMAFIRTSPFLTQTLMIGLCVGFISSHLTPDKLANLRINWTLYNMKILTRNISWWSKCKYWWVLSWYSSYAYTVLRNEIKYVYVVLFTHTTK